MRERAAYWIPAVAGVLILFACAQPDVKQLERPRADAAVSVALLNQNKLSQTSRRYLKQQQLLHIYQQDPAGLVDQLRQRLPADDSAEIRLTLAELCMDLGGRHAESDAHTAVGYFLAAADTAYALGTRSPPPSMLKLDAVAAYNHSAGQVFSILFSEGHPWHEQTAIAGPWRTYQLELSSNDDTHIDPEFFDEILPADYLKLRHTDVERIRRIGVGAAMVGYQEPSASISPLGMAAPLTVTLDFTEASGRVEMAMYDVTRTEVGHIGGRPVPLAADLTAPLILLYSRIKEPNYAWKGLLRPEAYIEHMNIIQLEPFQPDKIPVIFTHGLVSSPQIWLPALNELNADPLLEQNYQLFAFVYPTGFPIAYSAAALRARLEQLQTQFDPHGSNPYMQNVLLIGHSMGGILSNMQIRSSGDAMERLLFTSPIDELSGLTAQQRAALRSLLIYRASPQVTRAVFVGSPHRGSEDASGPRGAIGSALIKDPTDTVLTKPLPPIEDLTEVGHDMATRRLNGIESLVPYSPGLMAILEQPVGQGVVYHSVIGRKNSRQTLAGSSDGTVAYWSSHLDGAASEKVVNARHTPLPAHPEAIEELRRILYLHADLSYRR